MARTPKSGKGKKLDLSTAEQTDGALYSDRTAYEIAGIKEVSYREKSFAAYQTSIRAMDLVELHDHAYNLAVTPSPSRQAMLDRLEEKYLRENPRERESVAKARRAANDRPLTIQEQAERILAQGR
jgi:hypothetical protein